jgi:hypothetical protein
MTNTELGGNSNCIETAEEEPSPTSDSCSFGTLADFLVVGFFGSLVPTIKTHPLKTYTEQCWVRTYKMEIKNIKWSHTCNAF